MANAKTLNEVTYKLVLFMFGVSIVLVEDRVFKADVGDAWRIELLRL
jgi:hypothetical protein